MNFRDVPIGELRESDWSWHYDDESVAHKLDNSLALHGQLRAIVVRQVDGVLEIVEGRSLFRALQRAHTASVHIVDLGQIDRDAAILVALSLELRQEIDYVRLGREVSKLTGDVPSVAPFSSTDIGYYTILSAGFDWSQFHEEDRQEGLFGEEMAEVQAAEELSHIEDTPQGAPEPGTASPLPAPVKPPRTSPSTPVPRPSGPSALAFALSAAPAGPASRQVGERKTFPNGKVGVWDGTGWKQE